MRVLVISMLYEPDHAGIAPIATDLCHGLAARGHEVTVYTTHPYYREWRRKSEGNPWRVQRERVGGVSVERYGLFVPSEPSRLLPRLAHELSFPVSLARALFRGPRHDAVIVFCPLLGAVSFAVLRSALRGEPLWVNVQDIPVDAAVGTGIGGSGLFGRAAARVQSGLFARADVCSSISPLMVERLSAQRAHPRPVELRPNWLCGRLARLIDSLPSKVGRLPARPLKLLYAGNIGKKQGLLDFCERLASSSAEVEFRIHGDGAESAPLGASIEARRDARCVMGGFLEEPEFVRALQDTDLFVITERSGAGASFLPSKLIPCVATATPVVCVCDREGPLGREVSAHELGILGEWSDHGWLERALDGCRDGARFRQLQESCARHSRSYRREVALDEAERLLERLAAGSPRVHANGWNGAIPRNPR